MFVFSLRENRNEALYAAYDPRSVMAWADAQIWRCMEETPAIQDDRKVLELLNHTHTVQRFFLSAVQGDLLTREELSKQLQLADLRESYRQFHEQADHYLSKVRESHLNDHIHVPWFPEFQPKVSEALTQVVMHSQHHRAQVATLLRQLGAEPKPTDYIIWAAKDRPSPEWESVAAT